MSNELATRDAMDAVIRRVDAWLMELTELVRRRSTFSGTAANAGARS